MHTNTFHEEGEFIDMYISCTFFLLSVPLCCTIAPTTTSSKTTSTTPNRNRKKVEEDQARRMGGKGEIERLVYTE